MNRLGMASRGLAIVALLSMAAGACAPARVDARPHGLAVPVPPRPGATECDAMIRADIDAAIRVRDLLGLGALPATRNAAAAAAADPAADLDQFAIPVTPRELARLDPAQRGFSDPAPFLVLTQARPDLFGTVWLDGGTVMVGVIRRDDDVLRRARCLERGQLANNVRYVTVGVTPAELDALADRIFGDRDALRREGIDVTVVGSSPHLELVEVGVRELTPEIRDRLVERYGTVVTVREVDPQPALTTPLVGRTPGPLPGVRTTSGHQRLLPPDRRGA
jgi:hypothetical protein